MKPDGGSASGMSLRDAFAIGALQNVGWIDAKETKPAWVSEEVAPSIARFVYAIADAMLAERAK